MSDTQTAPAQNAVSTSRQLSAVDTMRKMNTEFVDALPAHITPEKFIRVAATAINSNADLSKMTPRSVIASCMKLAQMGLIPDGREAALVPFKGEATAMPMVAGIMKLVRNSGEIANISVQVVKENDQFDYELGDEEHMKHKPALKDRGQTVGVYSIVTLKDGTKSREWMDIEQVKAIQKRSRSGGSGPWITDFDEMARKTVFRRHAKRLPMSTDKDGDNDNRIQNAFAVDDEEFQTDATVTSISTGKTVTEQQPAKPRQTRAAAAVKAASVPVQEAPPTQPTDSDFIDAEVVPETPAEKLAGHGDEPPM